MPGQFSITNRSDGNILTAAIYNADRQDIVNHMEPGYVDDYSLNLTQMRTQTDPGESGTESLATTLAGELERIRYRLAEISGMTYHYETGSGIRAQSLAQASFPAAATAGRLVRRSDGARGLWMDNGSQWFQTTPWVNACEFGLVSGGSAAANVTALQAAIDSLTPNGGTVMIPPGDYSFNSTVYINDAYVEVRGPNAGFFNQSVILRYTGGAGTFLFIDRVYGGTLRGLYIQGPGATANVNAILVGGTAALIDSVTINNFSGTGSYGMRFEYQGSVEPSVGHFSNIWISGCHTGLYLDGVTNGSGFVNANVFTNLLVTSSTVDNIRLYNTGGTNFHGLTSLSAAQGGTGYNINIISGRDNYIFGGWLEGTNFGAGKGPISFPAVGETGSFNIEYHGYSDRVPTNLTATTSKNRSYFMQSPTRILAQDPPMYTALEVVTLLPWQTGGYNLGTLLNNTELSLTGLLPSVHGFMFVQTADGNHAALFYLRGGSNATAELLDAIGPSFTVTEANVGTTNIFYHAGSGNYRLENKTGGTLTYSAHMLSYN